MPLVFVDDSCAFVFVLASSTSARRSTPCHGGIQPAGAQLRGDKTILIRTAAYSIRATQRVYHHVIPSRLPTLPPTAVLQLLLGDLEASLQRLSEANEITTVIKSADAPLWLVTFVGSNCSEAGATARISDPCCSNLEASDDLEVRRSLTLTLRRVTTYRVVVMEFRSMKRERHGPKP